MTISRYEELLSIPLDSMAESGGSAREPGQLRLFKPRQNIPELILEVQVPRIIPKTPASPGGRLEVPLRH